MRNVMEDVRYGLRLLRKSPALTIVAVLTLALGIGANTAIYTLLDQALLRSLPVKEPNRLVFLRFSGGDTGSTHARGGSQKVFSYPMYRDLRDRNSVFSGLIATAWAQVSVQWHHQPDLAAAELVSGNDLEERRSKELNIGGRFKPGLTHPQGQAAIDALWRSIRAEELKQIGRTSQRFRDAFLTNSHLFLHDGSKGVPMHATMSTTLL